jgi:DNA polymerase III sliding clamp (beta) subunit (PCNA family)
MKIETKQFREIINELYKHVDNKKEGKFLFDGKKALVENEQYAYEIPLETGIQIMVPVEELSKIVNKINDLKITIEVKDDFFLLKTKKTKTKISCFPLTFFGNRKVENWEPAPDNFNEALGLTLFSASRDNIRPAFNSIHVNEKAVESTDNYRISQFCMSKKMNEFLLPLRSAVLVSKHKTVKYSVEENWIHFKNEDDSIFHSKIIETKFPSIKKVFDKYTDVEFFDLPQELSEIIDLVEVLAEGEHMLEKRILVQIEEGKIKCKAENETGWIESKTKINTKSNVQFLINPYFMKEILKISSQAAIVDGAIIFKSENFKHLMMTFKLEK